MRLNDDVCTINNPVSPASGAKKHREVDFSAGSGSLLRFERLYNSHGYFRHWFASNDDHTVSQLGTYWRSNFDRSIQQVTGNHIMAIAYREDGRLAHFTHQGTERERVSNRAAWTLEKLVDGGGGLTGWKLTDHSDSIELYDGAGKLVSVESRSGETLALSYAASGLLAEVVDSYGRDLQFDYAGNLLASVVLPDGTSLHFTYDEKRRLDSVERQDTALRRYHYEDPQFDYALTGITDEKGERLASYTYDGRGRVETSTAAPNHGDGAIGRYEYSYIDGVTEVVDPLGQLRRYLVTAFNGVRRLHSVDEACQGCGGSSTHVRKYDTLGYLDLTVDFRGTATDLTFDNRGLETVRSEGHEVLNVSPTGAPHCPHGGDYRPTNQGACSIGTCWSQDPLPTEADPFQVQLYFYNWNVSCALPSDDYTIGAALRRKETDWHASFRVPVEERVYAEPSSLESLRRWSHDSRGQTSASCMVDPTVPGALAYTCGSQTHAPAGVRQTTYARCEKADVEAPDSTCPILGLLKSVDGPRTDVADVTTYAYYPADDAGCDGKGGPCDHRKGDLHTITNALDHVTEYLAYDGAGRALAVRDANGVDTEFAYHARGWLLTRTVKGSGGAPDAVTTFAYDAAGNLTRITQPTGEFIDYEYDAAHRLEAIEDALGNRIEYELDAAGNRTREDTRDDQGVLKRTLSRVYNDLGRLIELKDAQNHTTVFVYDPNGNRTDETDPLLVETEHEYDPLNRLHSTLQDVGGIEADTGFEYDVLDRLVQVTDPKGLDTDYTYNALGDLLELDSPDTGVTTYTYDSAGNRLTQTDARGITATYAYDALNRLTAITYPDDQYDVSFAYDAGGGCSTSWTVGRLTGMKDGSGNTTYCYDHRGNVIEKRQDMNDLAIPALTVGYTYDLSDRVIKLRYPSGREVDYARDGAGRISGAQLTLPGGAPQGVVSGITYLPFGPATSYSFANGQTLTKTYDQDYRIQSVTSPALALAFDLDAVGNIVASGPSTGSWNETYGYDELYRLTDVKDGAGLIQFDRFAYDATGNREERQQQGGPVVPYAYPVDSHRLASVGFEPRAYDAMGNTTQGIGTVPGLTTITYGDNGRLVRWQVWDGHHFVYAHNGRGERVRKAPVVQFCMGVCPGEIFVYDEAGRLLGEYTTTGQARQEHIWVDDTPVALVESPWDEVFYVHSDHLNTPRALTDKGGILRWSWAFQGNAFGELAADSDPMSTGEPVEYKLRFPGQYFDAESGLHYNYFRDYEPGTGRYVESDPIGLGGGRSTYSYVGGTPLASLDPRGLQAQLAWCFGGPGPCLAAVGGTLICGAAASTMFPGVEGLPETPDPSTWTCSTEQSCSVPPEPPDPNSGCDTLYAGMVARCNRNFLTGPSRFACRAGALAVYTLCLALGAGE